MKIRLHRFAVWSNVFYLVPVVLALYFHLVWVAFVVSLLFLFSSAFHIMGEREFVRTDIAVAATIAILNIALLFLGGVKLLLLSAVLILVGVALGIRFVVERGNRGGIAHGFWHLTAAAITSLCLLSYALPF